VSRRASRRLKAAGDGRRVLRAAGGLSLVVQALPGGGKDQNIAVVDVAPT